MIFDNLEVKHKSFGMGVVVDKNGKYLTVKFANAEKKFVYPDAFESFLTLADGTVSEEIKNDLYAVNLAKQAILNKKNEENLRAMTKGIVIPGKENSANEGEDEEGRLKSNEQEEVL